MDVTPEVNRGGNPAKASVGEQFPVTALVFREGHDQLGAEVVLTDPAGDPPATGADARRARPAAAPRGDGQPRHRGRVDLRDPVVERHRRHLAARRRHQDPRRRRRRADVHRGRAAARAGAARSTTLDRRPRTAVLKDAVKALQDTDRPVEARLAAAESEPLAAIFAAHPLRDLLTSEGPFPFYVDRERALFSSWYEFFPRSEGAYVDEATGKVVSGTLRTAAERLQAVADMGFDIIYLPPIHPIGEVNRKGANNTLTPTPDDVGSPWAIGSKRRRPRRRPPRPRDARGLRRLRGRGPTRRAGGGARLRPPGGARPPLGDRAPGVVHHPRGRHHRLRREPAEEVPGHLPDQLRQRPRGDLRRERAAPAPLDVPRRPGLPRRQPAHQAAGLLGVAARTDPRVRPRRDLPGRGVHAAAADARARLDRLPPVLHALHLAHEPLGARAVPHRGLPRVLGT